MKEEIVQSLSGIVALSWLLEYGVGVDLGERILRKFKKKQNYKNVAGVLMEI